MTVTDKKNANKVTDVILNELNKAKSVLTSRDDLSRANEQVLFHRYDDESNPDSRALAYAIDTLFSTI